MKAYLFIETGEIRLPEIGEWIKWDSGYIQKITNTTAMCLPILARHEIEIPEGHNEFHYGTCYGKSVQDLEMPKRYSVIPIPRPKKKVKKWYWIIACSGNTAGWYANAGRRTEEEIKREYPDREWYHRIDETEIEVQE